VSVNSEDYPKKINTLCVQLLCNILITSLRGSVTTESCYMLTRQSPPTKCWWMHLCCSRITKYRGIASRQHTCPPFVRN